MRYKMRLFSLVALAAIALSPVIPAHAAYFQQYGTSTNGNYWLLDNGGGANRHGIGHGGFNFLTTGGITGLEFYAIKEPGASYNVDIALRTGSITGTIVASTTIYNTAIQETLATTTAVFSAPYTINSTSTSYYLTFTSTDTGDPYTQPPLDWIAIGANTSSTNPGTLYEQAKTSGSWSAKAAFNDNIVFSFLSGQEAVILESPAASSVITPFSSWVARLTYGYVDGDLQVAVDYGNAPGNLQFTDITSTSTQELPFIAQNLSVSVPLSRALTPGFSYWARTRLVRNGVTEYTSLTNDFIVSEDGVAGYLGSSFLNASSTNYSFCDDITDGGSFLPATCRFFGALFVPDEGVWASFINLKTALENKPPFGYITAITAALNFSSSSSSTIAFGGLSGIGIFDQFKTLTTWLLWIAFSFWIFNRFRHFQF